MNFEILFRAELDTEEEQKIASGYFSVRDSRMNISPNSTVIGRYSCLPYYKELEKDLKQIGSKLINNYEQHRFIANIENWYTLLEGYTPKTWFTRWDLLPENNAYVVKGRTNSRKWKWDTHMFSPNKRELYKVISRVSDDSLLSDQGICVRQYVPLRTFDYGINGIPFTNEWRLFFLGTQLISRGYYWACYQRDEEEDLPDKALKFAQEVANIVAVHTNFFVLDIAEKESGDWVLIELNDGQQSGLSDISPHEFYSNLSKVVSSSKDD